LLSAPAPLAGGPASLPSPAGSLAPAPQLVPDAVTDRAASFAPAHPEVAGSAALATDVAPAHEQPRRELFLVGAGGARLRLPRHAVLALVGVLVVAAGFAGMKMLAGGSSPAPQAAPAPVTPRAPALVRLFTAGESTTYGLKMNMHTTVTALGHVQPVDEKVLSKAADGTTTLRYLVTNGVASVAGRTIEIPASSIDVVVAPNGSIRTIMGLASATSGSGASVVSFLAPVLPAHVAAGMTWVRHDSQPIPLIGGALRSTSVYKVRSIGDGTVVVDGSTNGSVSGSMMSQQVQSAFGSAMAGGSTLDYQGTMAGHGTQTVDRATGQTQDVAGTMSLTMTLDANGSQIARVATSMTVDLRRAGPAGNVA
jgi:hypothetical protein